MRGRVLRLLGLACSGLVSLGDAVRVRAADGVYVACALAAGVLLCWGGRALKGGKAPLIPDK